LFFLFGSTLVVKIKKTQNPLRAFLKNKENIILLPVDSGLSGCTGDSDSSSPLVDVKEYKNS